MITGFWLENRTPYFLNTKQERYRSYGDTLCSISRVFYDAVLNTVKENDVDSAWRNSGRDEKRIQTFNRETLPDVTIREI
jgi:hypothetical protein